MVEIMNRLGVPAEEQGENFVAFPPSNRRDIKSDSDLAEEIARIYGYNSIPITNPKSPLSPGRLNKKSVNLMKIREAMRKSGFTEVINFSFMGTSSLDLIGTYHLLLKNEFHVLQLRTLFLEGGFLD